MAEEILSNGPMMFKTVEYTGDIVAGEGLEFDQNVLNFTGVHTQGLISGNGTEGNPITTSLPEIRIVSTAEEATMPNILYVVTGG